MQLTKKLAKEHGSIAKLRGAIPAMYLPQGTEEEFFASTGNQEAATTTAAEPSAWADAATAESQSATLSVTEDKKATSDSGGEAADRMVEEAGDESGNQEEGDATLLAAAQTQDSSANPQAAQESAGSAPTDPVIIAALAELAQLRNSMRLTMQELKNLNSAVALESEKVTPIINWMGKIQDILWPSPSDPVQVALGAPLDPLKYNHSLPSDSKYIDQIRVIMKLLDTSLLPPGMEQLQAEARAEGVDKIEDVALIVDAFKWMSWCNLALHVLRFPPPPKVLRKVAEAARPLKVVDEKIVKLVASTASKARYACLSHYVSPFTLFNNTIHYSLRLCVMTMLSQLLERKSEESFGANQEIR